MRIGTRESALALAQARSVASLLGDEAEIVEIPTPPDRAASMNDKSRWVSELERALLEGRIDVAVHSAKDIPTELPDGLELVAIPPRADARDAICGAASLPALPAGARIGTSTADVPGHAQRPAAGPDGVDGGDSAEVHPPAGGQLPGGEPVRRPVQLEADDRPGRPAAGAHGVLELPVVRRLRPAGIPPLVQAARRRAGAGAFAGYVLNGDHFKAGSPEMALYTREALEEIEYVSGPADSEWGKRRAADGFPEPFPLHYVEIGNEDWFDRSGSYDGRFAQMARAIREQYPHLKIIASAPVKSFTPDLYDDHFYRSPRQLMQMATLYDPPADRGRRR